MPEDTVLEIRGYAAYKTLVSLSVDQRQLETAANLRPARGESYPFDCLLPFAKTAGDTFPAFNFLSDDV